MNGREMNDSSGRGHGRWRSWPRWAATLAVMALTGLLATACGGGSSPAASVAGGATRAQAALAYARCMRSHGVPNYPDPNPNGGLGAALAQLGINPNSPQFQATLRTCNRLVPMPSQRGGS